MESIHFTAFYHKNVDRIYKFFYFRVGGKVEIAQDLTQDVFLKAYAAFASYDEKISQSSWIFTIARNHFINWLEKQRPQTNLDEVAETMLHDEAWHERLELDDDTRHLLEALQKLDPPDAELIRLRYLEGWNFDDLAEKLNKKSVTLRVHTIRLLKQLRKIMQQKQRPSVK